MTITATTRITGESAGECLSDQALRELLDEPVIDGSQHQIVQHLDHCPTCQSRLQDAAGDGEIWSAAVDGLVAERFESHALNHATETLRAAGVLTLINGVRTPLACEIDFLQPCDVPNRLGRLGHYEIIELLGQGGMGYVFKAYDPVLSRVVALKVLAAPIAQGSRARQRFQREARSVAAVRSDHVVAVHAVEDEAELPYLVMEFIEGQSLDDFILNMPNLAWRDVIRVGAEIADGLQAAHAAGLVHRDIKPANILLESATGRVKITDFGLARAIDDTGLTQDGCVIGTPEFMAPEQASNGSVSHAADLFSLGSVLYAMCTGKPPFVADSTMAVLRRTQDEQPTPIDDVRQDVPAGLVDVINKLMQKDPEARYSTAADVSDALRSVSIDGSDSVVSPSTSRFSSSGQFLMWTVAMLFLAACIGLVGFGISSASQFAAGVFELDDDQGPAEGSTNAVAMLEEKKRQGKKKGKNKDNPKEKAAAEVVVEPPQRIQIVTPESLMRERIRMTKDQIPETKSPFLVRKFVGHTGPVKGVDFSPDGKFAVSGSGWPVGDRTLRLWDVATGKEIRQFDMAGLPLHPERCGPREVPGEIMCLDFAAKGTHVVAGLAGGAVGMWNSKTGKLVRHFEGHESTIYDVEFSPDGKRILTASRDSTVRLWDVATGDELMRIPNSKSWMRSVAFSPDGQRALVGSYDKKLRHWDLVNAEMLAELSLRDWAWDVTYSPSGTHAAVVSGNTITIWNLNEPNQVRKIVHPGNATCVAYSPDGSRLISGGYDMSLQVWDVGSGKKLETFEGHRGWVWSVAFSPDGQTVLSGGGGRLTPNQGTNAGIDFELRLWQMPPRETRIVKPR